MLSSLKTGPREIHAVWGRKELKRKLVAWSPTRVLVPWEGKGGRVEEALGNSENGTAPPALIFPDL